METTHLPAFVLAKSFFLNLYTFPFLYCFRFSSLLYRYIMILVLGYRPNCNQKMKQIKGHSASKLNPNSLLIIKLPHSRILGIISKSLLLAILILALHSIGSFVRDASEEHSANSSDILPMVFKDLSIEGLFRDGQKGLLLSSVVGDLFDSLWFLNDKGIDLVTDSDLDRQMVIPNEVFDFVFASSSENAKFINRVVKLDGIVVMPLGNYYDKSYEFLKRSNYKIVYLRQFDSKTVIAMRKIDGQGEEGVFGG